MENCLNKAELRNKFNICAETLDKILDYLKLPFEIKIASNYKRVPFSNHDLPPSYDGKYGYYDFDLKSKDDTRNGLLGDALFYGDFIEYVADLVTEANKNTQVHEIEKILSDKKFLDWLYDKVEENGLRFKIMDLQELKTVRQVQSYIDDYMYDDELEIIYDKYSEYLK